MSEQNSIWRWPFVSRKRLDGAIAKYNRVRGYLNTANAAKFRVEKEREDLQVQHDKMVGIKEAIAGKRDEWYRSFLKAETQKSEAEHARDQAIAKFHKMRQERDNFEAAFEGSKTRIADLGDERDDAKKNAQLAARQYESEIQEHKASRRGLYSDLQDARGEIKKLGAENDGLMEDVEAWKAEANEVRDDRDRIQKELEETQRSRDYWKNQHESLSGLCTETTKERDEALKSRNEWKNTVARLEDANKHLKEQASDAQENAQKAVAEGNKTVELAKKVQGELEQERAVVNQYCANEQARPVIDVYVKRRKKNKRHTWRAVYAPEGKNTKAMCINTGGGAKTKEETAAVIDLLSRARWRVVELKEVK